MTLRWLLLAILFQSSVVHAVDDEISRRAVGRGTLTAMIAAFFARVAPAPAAAPVIPAPPVAAPVTPAWVFSYRAKLLQSTLRQAFEFDSWMLSPDAQVLAGDILRDWVAHNPTLATGLQSQIEEYCRIVMEEIPALTQALLADEGSHADLHKLNSRRLELFREIRPHLTAPWSTFDFELIFSDRLAQIEAQMAKAWNVDEGEVFNAVDFILADHKKRTALLRNTAGKDFLTSIRLAPYSVRFRDAYAERVAVFSGVIAKRIHMKTAGDNLQYFLYQHIPSHFGFTYDNGIRRIFHFHFPGVNFGSAAELAPSYLSALRDLQELQLKVEGQPEVEFREFILEFVATLISELRTELRTLPQRLAAQPSGPGPQFAFVGSSRRVLPAEWDSTEWQTFGFADAVTAANEGLKWARVLTAAGFAFAEHEMPAAHVDSAAATGDGAACPQLLGYEAGIIGDGVVILPTDQVPVEK